MRLPNNSILASGPVIIENNKVLLNREIKNPDGITCWLFPGGGVEDFDISLEETCKREVKEEMGINVKIIKPMKTTIEKTNCIVVICVHFLAERIGEIKPGSDIAEWAWHDINNLPDNCGRNVYEVIAEYKNL